MAKNNKIYIPADAIAKHEDFDTWYEDGSLFYRFESPKGWSSEKDKVVIIGRMGGQTGAIKPDSKTVGYYLSIGQWEYYFRTYLIFKHYGVEGMLWDIKGTLTDLPLDFVGEHGSSEKDVRYTKDVHVSLVTFNDQPCYEVRVKDLKVLRVAVASVVAMAIKEEWKGFSEGEGHSDKEGLLARAKRAVSETFTRRGPISYEELLQAKILEAKAED